MSGCFHRPQTVLSVLGGKERLRNALGYFCTHEPGNSKQAGLVRVARGMADDWQATQGRSFSSVCVKSLRC
ncbi:hypothetical protein SCLCIDRAFT_1220544 [Scleroderma citrinum Foug A]|uniref:Uncharacterized protein n=1 Tax=Scleroderma citrinum Foug A TaxID=1036808 RepID=A0A0C2ZUL0_9AGAM|nr:hypothetical protein SCLCIDRAFT_1220544 [Scleroderma citrinum Foug A]